ncbi:MAG: PAS domain S-box protein, partial [Spirochaetales bacterium]|nr:PAS domain S-box protein [Spirochaetales bacterium]
VWSPVYILFTGQDLAVAASRPVYDEQGELLGVVAADLFLSDLSQFLRDLTIGETGQAFIIERSGLLIASSAEELPFTVQDGDTPQRRLDATESEIPIIRYAAQALIDRLGDYECITDSCHIDFNADDGRQFLHVSSIQHEDGLDWLVAVVVPESDFMARIMANNRTTVGLIAATLALAVVIGVIAARRITRPILRLAATARTLARGEWTKTIPDWGWTSEVSTLARSFNKMAGQLQRMLNDLNHEIAERKQAERELRSGEEKYRLLVENQTDLIIKFDTEGRLLFVSQSYCDTFGKTREQLIDTDILPVVHEEDREAVAEAVARVYAPPYSSYVEERDLTVAGWRWQAWLNTAILDDSNQVVAITAVGRDITDRKNMELALLDSEQRLNAIFQASPTPIVVYDTDGLVQYCNPAFERTFGWTLAELEGEHIPFLPEDEEQADVARASRPSEAGPPRTVETQRLTRDGRTLDVLISAASIRGIEGQPTGLVVSLADITDRRKLEEQYRSIQRLEAVGTLAGGVAHDFNNLLMGIQGNVSLMRSDLGVNDAQEDRLRGMEQCVRLGADLTNQLLGFAKGGKYNARPTDLNKIVKTHNQMFGRMKKEISIRGKYERDLWTVNVDQSQMEQVLLNIYINAWQAMPAGGDMSIRTSNAFLDENQAKLFDAAPGRYVEISVVDTGTGMDEVTRSKMFEPFFTTKEIGRGTGLGLASVHGIIKNHGGFIDVQSEEGRGTTFDIYLPAVEEEASPAVTTSTDGVVDSGHGETILLVDDEEMITRVGEQMLETLGYRVIVANGGEQAIAIIENMGHEINLVILDMIMPVMDGASTFDRVRSIIPTMPVVLCSGYSMDGRAGAIMRKGCNGFVQKPFTLSDLSQAVGEVLRELI